MRVAAGSGGGSLPLSPLPPSWRNWGRGGDVRAPPCPSLGAGKGFSGGVRLRDCSGGDLGGCAEPHLPELPCLPGSLSLRPRLGAPLTAGVPCTQHPSGPGPGPDPRCAPLSGCLSFQLPPAAIPTPGTAGDALPLLQLKLVATRRLPGVCREEARTASAAWPGRLGLCSPPTSGGDLF